MELNVLILKQNNQFPLVSCNETKGKENTSGLCCSSNLYLLLKIYYCIITSIILRTLQFKFSLNSILVFSLTKIVPLFHFVSLEKLDVSNNCLSGKFIKIHSCFSNNILLGFCSKYGRKCSGQMYITYLYKMVQRRKIFSFFKLGLRIKLM